MPKIHTHYDNLKVARNAPAEVVRAAYKTLSQSWHPDRQKAPQAEGVMKIINASYEVLSDPEKRAEHDAWIERQEQGASFENVRRTESIRRTPPAAVADNDFAHYVGASVAGATRHMLRNWRIYGSGGFIAFIIFSANQTAPTREKPYQQSASHWANPSGDESAPAVAVPAIVKVPGKIDKDGWEDVPKWSPADHLALDKPTTAPVAPSKYVPSPFAPNGRAWPTQAAYVPGYPILHNNGLSSVTIDNSQNDSDVFVKIITIDGGVDKPVRQFYVPARGSFMAENVSPGEYDVRYRDLLSGALSRSEPMKLEQIEIENGTRFSQMRMTLYKVRNGNMKTYPLAETEF